jgi:hypothetical protein
MIFEQPVDDGFSCASIRIDAAFFVWRSDKHGSA